MVTRESLKPTHAPATNRGCIKINQPSVFFCVVPVLPATSARTSKRARTACPVPLSTASRSMLINMLRDAVDKGTGQAVRARFDVRADVAGKTGTTQKNTDGWFILMHPRLVAGAWVGFNDSRVTMRSNYWGEGGHNAVLVVADFFKQALAARLIDGGA